MGKKLLFEDVKKAFEKRNYQLLEKEYIRSHIPMKFSCPNHPNEELHIRLNYSPLNILTECLKWG